MLSSEINPDHQKTPSLIMGLSTIRQACYISMPVILAKELLNLILHRTTKTLSKCGAKIKKIKCQTVFKRIWNNLLNTFYKTTAITLLFTLS